MQPQPAGWITGMSCSEHRSPLESCDKSSAMPECMGDALMVSPSPSSYSRTLPPQARAVSFSVPSSAPALPSVGWTVASYPPLKEQTDRLEVVAVVTAANQKPAVTVLRKDTGAILGPWRIDLADANDRNWHLSEVDREHIGEGYSAELEPIFARLGVRIVDQLTKPKPVAVSNPQAPPEQVPPTEEELYRQCGELATKPDILAEVWGFVQRSGVAGVEKQVKTVFLSTLSTLRWDPVNLAIKGPSAAGKSYMVKQTQVLFPPEAIYVRTSISPMSVAYSQESFVHRQIVIFEQHGIAGEKGSYMIRTLLSEGEIVHEVTKETADGNRSTQVVRKPGPTGFLTTTTLPSLHGENETRLFTIEVPDDNAQTRRIMRAIGAKYSKGAGPAEDVSVWHASCRWLRAGERRVVVPFAGHLSELVPDVAIRLRRDFKAVAELVAVHALLHRASRERDADGQIIATV